MLVRTANVVQTQRELLSTSSISLLFPGQPRLLHLLASQRLPFGWIPAWRDRPLQAGPSLSLSASNWPPPLPRPHTLWGAQSSPARRPLAASLTPAHWGARGANWAPIERSPVAWAPARPVGEWRVAGTWQAAGCLSLASVRSLCSAPLQLVARRAHRLGHSAHSTLCWPTVAGL